MRQVTRDMERFLSIVAEIGFNAVTFDDVAHLMDSPYYDAPLRRLIAEYREAHRTFFAMAADRGLQVFVTTHIMFYHRALRRRLGSNHDRILSFLSDGFRGLFRDFPPISGIITRIGEFDDLDVEDRFTSRLAVRLPSQARRYVRTFLPVFEEAGKTLVFRTWRVGAYRVGDLVWNRETFREVFEGLESPHLVISIKHGETDFFRYLPLNKQFLRKSHRKIVEVQARRAYEGAGEYPAFVGEEYTVLRERLREVDNVDGGLRSSSPPGCGTRSTPSSFYASSETGRTRKRRCGCSAPGASRMHPGVPSTACLPSPSASSATCSMWTTSHGGSCSSVACVYPRSCSCTGTTSS
jgi:hypothetical protein